MPSNRASRDRRKRPVIYLRLLSPDVGSAGAAGSGGNGWVRYVRAALPLRGKHGGASSATFYGTPRHTGARACNHLVLIVISPIRPYYALS